MFKAVDSLEAKMFQYMEDEGAHDRGALVAKCKSLFQRTTEMMQGANKKCGALPYKQGFAHSVELQDAANSVIRLKKARRLIAAGIIEDDLIDSQGMQRQLQKAYIHLRETQQGAAELRADSLAELAEKRAGQWNTTAAKAILVIKEAEKSRRLHAKHRRFIKQENLGTLRSILVPAPVIFPDGGKNDLFDVKQYYRVHDTEQLFDILLRRNFRHLLMSKHSLFSRGSIGAAVGWEAEGEACISQLLAGTFSTEKISDEYPEYGVEAEAFIKALKKPLGKDDTPLKDFKWKYGVEEYCATFKKTRESTACGPSGLHMSHWKAATERKRIARVHAFFIWAAFQFGFSYPRWEASWHCMIQKLEDPLYSKLRIVQLFEGDFNGALKYFLGRLLMYHSTNEDVHDPETFGSRIGKTAPEAILALQLLYDHARSWSITFGMLFNDAAGCYDCIPPQLADIAMRRLGCPASIAKTHTITQRRMAHFIRIAAGISKAKICFAIEELMSWKGEHLIALWGLLGGIGQGGGGGPMIWLAIITIMLAAFRTLSPGATMMDVLGLFTLIFWMISYVDDNTLVQTFPNTATPMDVIRGLTISMRHWQKLLQVTGGDLSLDKCKVSIMVWKRNNYWGKPGMMSTQEAEGTVRVSSAFDQHQVEWDLERLEPWKAERVLGVRVPLTGEMKWEYNFRMKQMKTLAKRLYTSPFDFRDSYMVYAFRYRPMIKFPLPVTTFSREECHELQKPVIFKLLPKMGINRHTPRAVIYGPKSLGGRQLMDLRIEQPVLHWEATLGHLRRHDKVGKAARISLHDHQVIIGTTEHFFKLDPQIYNYGDQQSRWRYVWKTFFEYGIKLQLYDLWQPRLTSNNDRNIMEVAANDPHFLQKHWKVEVLNRCRLFLEVFNLSEMVDNNGNFKFEYLDGSTRYKHPEVSFPAQARPPAPAWELWKSFIFRNFLGRGYRVHPHLVPAPNWFYNTPTLKPTEGQFVQRLYTLDLRTLEEVRDFLPATLGDILGTMTTPDDNGKSISTAILEGYCIGASDGSLVSEYQRSYGGHAFSLHHFDTDEDCIIGRAPTPTTDTMSSLTTEQYGALGVVLLLHMVCIIHKITASDHVVDIYLDNEEVTKRGGQSEKPMNVSSYLAADFDVWQLIVDLIQALPISARLRWVKGHQDLNNKGETIHGPFTRPAQLNIKMDAFAEEGRRQGNNSVIHTPTWSTTVAQLYTQNGMATTNIRKFITESTNGEALLEYYLERRDWTSDIVRTIDWEAMSAFLSRQSAHQRNKLTQMMHNWQNTGYQKLQFIPDTDGVDKDESIADCPIGCGIMEYALHYLHCGETSMVNYRRQARTQMSKDLHKIGTYQGIISVIIKATLQLETNDEMEFEIREFRGPEGILLGNAIREQSTISWMPLLQGFMSNNWKKCQHCYMERNGLIDRKHRAEIWAPKFLGILTEYTMNCWHRRCDILHGKEEDEHRIIILDKCKKRTKKLYAQSKRLTRSKDKDVFSIPQYIRMKQGMQGLQKWIAVAEEVIRNHREESAKNTLDHWLINREGLPLNP